ncbi:DUF3501 family protein [uncultured Thiothrix sp.]|uniref:DUF3501 family protein n=1 Tax=uncultured Thiothrix sp. TaxID=223185 RepID=UPI0026106706|nr:DUF3501 family protein [uncultured Thiothrix sp.]
MTKLTRADLMSLEQYAEQRSAFREKVIAHKAARKIAIGSNATLYFEDRLTIQYQIQEMLRVERIFEAAGIEEELAAYNPLIPDGSNWKATFMLEFPNPEERKLWLAKLLGIERQTWVQVAGFEPVFAIANEDLSRETAEKTAAVHFMRFELSTGMVAAVKAGASVSMGINHPNYTHSIQISQVSQTSLAADLS